MKRLILLVALISTIAAVGAEPPYGCYKQLRWGMNPEVARKTVGATETRTVTKGNVSELIFAGLFHLNGATLDVTLSFKGDKLFKVEIDYPAEDPHSQSCRPGATERISGYQVLKEALDKKYGKAKKENGVAPAAGVKMEDAICQSTGKLGGEWETAYSKITLSAELVLVREGKPIFVPLLVYIDKTQIK